MADDLSDDTKVALFVMGAMHRLAEEGLVQVGTHSFTLSLKGVAMFDQLVASGFRPLEPEMRECLLYMLNNSPALLDQEPGEDE